MKSLKTLAANIKVDCVRVGFDPATERTKFVVIIGGQHFDYFCGILASLPEKPLKALVKRWWYRERVDNSLRVYNLIRQGGIRAIKNTAHPHVMRVYEELSRLCAPTAYDVLYCLKIDSDAVGMSFADWCSAFGYNDDSIKALGVYNACVDNARKLQQALGESLFRELMESDPEE